MGNGINVSYKTRTYAAFLKSSGKKRDGQSVQPGSFRSAAERIARSAAKQADACSMERVPAGGRETGDWAGRLCGCKDLRRVKEMGLYRAGEAESVVRDLSLEEYKLYIYDQISRIPQDPSQAGWNWYVDISEAGFEAMKNDADYEAHVLDSIRRNFAAVDPFHSSTFSILHFGASEEESFGHSYSYDRPADHLQDEEESYWDKRKAYRKKLQELLDDLAEKRAVVRLQGLLDPTMPDIQSILELLCAGA